MDDYEKYLTNDIALTIHLKHTIHNAPEALKVIDFQRLFYINQEFENRTFDWVGLIFFLFGQFDFVRSPNSIELNPPIEFD